MSFFYELFSLMVLKQSLLLIVTSKYNTTTLKQKKKMEYENGNHT